MDHKISTGQIQFYNVLEVIPKGLDIINIPKGGNSEAKEDSFKAD
jgi:hypothetical protein